MQKAYLNLKEEFLLELKNDYRKSFSFTLNSDLPIDTSFTCSVKSRNHEKVFDQSEIIVDNVANTVTISVSDTALNKGRYEGVLRSDSNVGGLYLKGNLIIDIN